MKKTLVERLLTGRVTAANVNATADALVALPAGATLPQISTLLQAPPASLAAADADALAREILAHHAAVDAARDGIAIEDPVNKFVRANDIDLTDIVRQPALTAALAGVVQDDPANPLLRRTDAARFLTVAHGDEFRQSLGRARGLGWVALIVALLLLALGLWKNSDVDDRLAGHDGRLSTLAASDAATLTALTKLTADQTGLATQVADHESRIGTLEGTVAVHEGRLNGYDAAAADATKKQAAIAWRLAKAEKAALASCQAGGMSEADCKSALKTGKSLYTAPSAPASGGLVPTPPSSADNQRLEIDGDNVAVRVVTVD